MKTCSVCAVGKETRQFYKNKHMKDGLLNQCIECVQARKKKFKDENRDHIRNQHRQSYLRNREKRIQKASEYYRARPEVNAAAVALYRARKPKEDKARQMLQDAVKLGKIKRQPCEECGSDVSVHAHHEDYNKPFEVMWLCSTCHGARHREINELARQKVLE